MEFVNLLRSCKIYTIPVRCIGYLLIALSLVMFRHSFDSVCLVHMSVTSKKGVMASWWQLEFESLFAPIVWALFLSIVADIPWNTATLTENDETDGDTVFFAIHNENSVSHQNTTAPEVVTDLWQKSCFWPTLIHYVNQKLDTWCCSNLFNARNGKDAEWLHSLSSCNSWWPKLFLATNIGLNSGLRYITPGWPVRRKYPCSTSSTLSNHVQRRRR